MGRKGLPDRVLLKLPAGTLDAIDARLKSGQSRSGAIRAAIGAWLEATPRPLTSADFGQRHTIPSEPVPVAPKRALTAADFGQRHAADEKLSPAIPDTPPAPEPAPPEPEAVNVESPDEKVQRFLGQMRAVTQTLPEAAASPLDKPAVRRTKRGKDETGPNTDIR